MTTRAEIAWIDRGAGEPVVFLHGLGMTATGWEPQLAALSDAFRCIAWDMPGYGDSPLPAGGLTFAVVADAVAALLDAAGVDAAHLVGLSLGGQIALHAALAHPRRVRSLALLDTSPAFGLDGTDPDEWMALRLDPLDRGVTPAEMAEPVLRSIMAPDVATAVVAAAVASMRRIDAEGLHATVRMLPSHDVRDRLGEIACPTLVVVGELDRETPPVYAEALAAAIAGARLAVIPAVGHITSMEAPAAVNRLLRDHLTR
jgi:pimeloyl-ACP methyl ester carboxylesterase